MMPVPNTSQSCIADSLKKSLSHSKKSSADVSQTVASSAKRSLLEKAEIKFVKAEKDANSMLQNLKNKYICLNGNRSVVEGGDKSEAAARDRLREDGMGKPKVILYPADKVKLMWDSPRRVGAGLANLGNTCFLNSVLQCLCYTPPLANHLTSGLHKPLCRSSGFCMLCELQQHVCRSLTQNGGSLKPIGILQKLKLIAKNMRWGRQEDAHEFLRYVVDAMQKACLAGQSNSLDKLSKETTFMHQVFGGYLRSQVKCLQCKTTSNTYDPVLDISVDLKGVNSVEKALQKFVQPEMLDIDNAYKCSRCKKKVRALKQFTIHRAPKVLTVHLKRFDYHRLIGGKVNRHIEFSHKMNIRSFMSHKQGDPVNYNLYGVLVHSGHSCNSGHYYCYIKAPNQTWYCMNDSHVSQAGMNTVLKAEAYMLFYSLSTSKQSTTQKPTVPVASTHTPSHKGASVQGVKLARPKTANGPILLKTPSSIMQNGSSLLKKSTSDASSTQSNTRRISLTTINDLITEDSSNSHKKLAMTKSSACGTVDASQETAPLVARASNNTVSVINRSVDQVKKHKMSSEQPMGNSEAKKARLDSSVGDIKSDVPEAATANKCSGKPNQVSPRKLMSPPRSLSIKSSPPSHHSKFPPLNGSIISPPLKSPPSSNPIKSPPLSQRIMSPPPSQSVKSALPNGPIKTMTHNWQVARPVNGRSRTHSGSESCSSVNSTTEWQVTTTPKKCATQDVKHQACVAKSGVSHNEQKKRRHDSTSSVSSLSEASPGKKSKVEQVLPVTNGHGGASSVPVKYKSDGTSLDMKRVNESTPLPLDSGSSNQAAGDAGSAVSNIADSVPVKKKKKRKRKKKKSALLNGNVSDISCVADSSVGCDLQSRQLNGNKRKKEKIDLPSNNGEGEVMTSEPLQNGYSKHGGHSNGANGELNISKKKTKTKKLNQNGERIDPDDNGMTKGRKNQSVQEENCVSKNGVVNEPTKVDKQEDGAGGAIPSVHEKGNGLCNALMNGGTPDPVVKKKKKRKSLNPSAAENGERENSSHAAVHEDKSAAVTKKKKQNLLQHSLGEQEECEGKLLTAKEKMKKKRRYSEPVVKEWDEKVDDEDVALRREASKMPVSVWDGRRDSNISFILERHASVKGLGSGVTTWDGRKSEINIEVERERLTDNYKDGWYDGYEQEIDEGKMKKIKKVKSAYKHKGNQKYFQSIQNNTNAVQQLKKEGKLPSLPSYR